VQISMGVYATHRLELPTYPPLEDDGDGATATYSSHSSEGYRDTAVLHDLEGSIRLYLSEDRSNLALSHAVHAYANQSYSLRLRFAAPLSGWSFDETLELSVHRPARGYHGWLHFARPSLPFAPGENLTVTVAQADWHSVIFDDWRSLHGVLWHLRMCGVPQSAEAYGRREKAFG